MAGMIDDYKSVTLDILYSSSSKSCGTLKKKVYIMWVNII